MRRCKGIWVWCRLVFVLLACHAVLAPAQTAPSSSLSIGTPFPIASGLMSMGGAFDGTNHLMALQSDKQTAIVAAQLMSPSGAKVGAQIAVGRSGQTCCTAVAFDGTNYLMVWEDDQGIKNSASPFMVYGQFISKAGVAQGQPIALSSAGIWLDGMKFLAYGGGKYLLTYTRLIVPANGDRSDNRYIAGRIVAPDGTLGNELRISAGFGAGSSVGFDGSNFLVVWREDALDYEVRARLVSPAGALVGQEISINASQAPSDSPLLVGFDGTNYMVVFHDAVGAASVAPTLAAVAGTWTLASTNDAYSFPSGNVLSVDALGKYTSVMPGCWHSGTLSVSGGTYKMNVLSSTGCLAPGSVITGAMELTANSVKVFNGSAWGLFQRSTTQSVAEEWDALGQQVSTAGALVGGVIKIATDPGAQFATGIVFDGTHYLITWTDMQNITNWDIYGRYIGKDGALVGDKFVINADAGNQLGGVGGFANGRYFVAVNSGVQISSNGVTQVGDVSGLFLSLPPVIIAPSSLSVGAPAVVQSSGRVSLSATAGYTDGSSRAVSAAWSSSDAAVATVSAAGVLSASSVTLDTPVTLSATYTDNGVTVSATKTITISAAPATLAGIAVSGSSSVQSGGQALFKVTATYSDGSSRQVTPGGWTLSNAALGSVSSRGVFAAGTVTANTALTVTASYSEGAITRSASAGITISAVPAVLSGLAVVGAQGSVVVGTTLSLAAEGRYIDGSRKPVSATWQVSNTAAASISASGVLNITSVPKAPVLITARYSEGGVSVSAEYQILIEAMPAPSPTPPAFQASAEVEVAGTRTDYSLSVWFKAGAAAPVAAAAQKRAGSFAAAESYKVYVAAWVPAGPLLSVPALFLLNRSNQWQALSFPLAEYLSGVAQNDWQLLEVVANLDVSMLSGTLVHVGYGTSDTEMLAAGRYKVVYQVP